MQRTLKIEEMGDMFEKRTFPAIRLKGHWLKRAGFYPGDYVQATQLQSGVLELRVITPINLTAESLAIMSQIDSAIGRTA